MNDERPMPVDGECPTPTDDQCPTPMHDQCPTPNPSVALAEIELDERDGVRLVAVVGELDISNVGALRDATFDLPNDRLGVVIDLSAATYIDSAALGLLFKLRHALQRRGQVLRVVCPSAGGARRVLDLTGFDPEITDEERETAIATIRAAVPLDESPQTASGRH